MPKMKTNKSIARRVKVTARGKLLRNKAGFGHLKSVKSAKRLRGSRKQQTVSTAFARQVRTMLGK